MTDILAVRGITAYGFHGVFEHERQEGQQFVIDLALGVDTSRAAESDDLADTVDYGSLVTDVVAAVEYDPVDLIEKLATRISRVCLLREQVAWVEVTVHKPNAPIQARFDDVTLTIKRSRQ